MEILLSMSSAVAKSKGIDISKYYVSLIVDEDTREKTVKIIDNITGEVVKRIKAEEILDFSGEKSDEI